MTVDLAHIVAQANIGRLSLIGLAKNVGKTTVTNHLLETLLAEQLCAPEHLALTSLGLDGEAVDAMTGLPKPRYVPQAGLLIATTADLLRQAESEGMQVERLAWLPGRTALGSVILARVLRPGRVVIAGPTLLRDLRSSLDTLRGYGARLAIVDGAINRVGAAAPDITDACIFCTGASAGATPTLVARRSADLLARLAVPVTRWNDAYKKLHPQTRLLSFPADRHNEEDIERFPGPPEPAVEASWIAAHIQNRVYLLRGAFTEELARALLAQLPSHIGEIGEVVVGDSTKIFCHSVVLQRLAARGLNVRVAHPIRVLALTINPYAPAYPCTSEQLLEALLPELPVEHPPILDVVSGLWYKKLML